MILATATTPRTARKPRPSRLAALLRRHERTLAALDSAAARHGLVVWDDDGLTKSMSHQPAAVRHAAEAATATAHEVILALLDLHRPELPGWVRWHLALGPIVRHRMGNRLLLVVPGDGPATMANGGSEPIDVGDVAAFARLVVVDLDA